VDLLTPQEHVRDHRELVDERQVLVDAVDPERARVVDRLELDLLAAMGINIYVGRVRRRSGVG